MRLLEVGMGCSTHRGVTGLTTLSVRLAHLIPTFTYQLGFHWAPSGAQETGAGA
jgi:hypothetical protein